MFFTCLQILKKTSAQGFALSDTDHLTLSSNGLEQATPGLPNEAFSLYKQGLVAQSVKIVFLVHIVFHYIHLI